MDHQYTAQTKIREFFVGERMMRYLRQYAQKVNEARLDEILARVPDVDPIPGDECL